MIAELDRLVALSPPDLGALNAAVPPAWTSVARTSGAYRTEPSSVPT